MSTNTLVGAEAAARRLGLSRSGFNKAVQEGRIPVAARLGKRGTYVFDRAEIEAIAAEEKTA